MLRNVTGGVVPLMKGLRMMSSSRSVSEWKSDLLNKKPGEILVARTIADMQNLRAAMDLIAATTHGRLATVGFVPTMGSLHEGHLSLIDVARKEHGASPADYVVSSIFVNPTQFAPHEDLSKYPRTWLSDLEKLKAHGTDVVFAPTAPEMYPPSAPFRTFVNLSGIDSSPEGTARPGFFRGVATVVSKLFNAVRPTVAAFGQKDGIQSIVIRTMTRDLNFPLHIVVCPTGREPDGLAMSSRNVYLTEDQRKAAPAIHRAMLKAREVFLASDAGRQYLEQHPHLQVGGSSKPKVSDGSSGLSNEDAEKAAQAAAVSARVGAVPPEDLFTETEASRLARSSIDFKQVTKTFEDELRAAKYSEFLGETEYCAFNCGLSGDRVYSLSEVRGSGAIMLSVAVKVGSTRLIDNIMLVGGLEHLGQPSPLH